MVCCTAFAPHSHVVHATPGIGSVERHHKEPNKRTIKAPEPTTSHLDYGVRCGGRGRQAAETPKSWREGTQRG
jgi:hypothetical protein